jgi:hypothetical protein
LDRDAMASDRDPIELDRDAMASDRDPIELDRVTMALHGVRMALQGITNE